jgi:oxalate decarboxylase
MSHRFPLGSMTPHSVSEFGSRTTANRGTFPILKGLALYRLVLKEGCFREPHWHANADELGYCLGGAALVTIFANGNVHEQFEIGAGEMFFVPSGALHAIENVGAGDAEFVICFSHEAPEDFGLSGTVGSMTANVMGNTWGVPESDLAGVTRSRVDVEFGRIDGLCEIPASALYVSPHKFAVEARNPLLSTDYGSVRVARRDTWPALRAQAMYSLRLHGIGMREPHWHPETAELGYVLQGHARMTVKSPGDSIETYELQPGDCYFIPRAYPHHIENLGDDEVRFLIFFDTPDVQDIGFTGAIPAFPQRIVGPTLGLSNEQYERIPKIPSDLLLVKKTNPVI